jgi:hypothetical protein
MLAEAAEVTETWVTMVLRLVEAKPVRKLRQAA